MHGFVPGNVVTNIAAKNPPSFFVIFRTQIFLEAEHIRSRETSSSNVYSLEVCESTKRGDNSVFSAFSSVSYTILYENMSWNCAANRATV